jgi:oligopeptide transport system substrate-binding protein
MLSFVKGADAYNQGKGSADQVGVKAIDDKTLEVTLENPTPFFLKQTAFPTYFPLNQKFVESKGKDYGANLESTLANGPFKITSWEHDVAVVIEKNADYWDANTVKLNKVTFNVIKDSNAGLNMYESGELDRTGLVRDQIDRYKDTPDYKVNPELTNGFLIFNPAVKGLENAKVRSALTFAIDRDMYANIIYNNGTVGATGFVPNGTSDSAGGEFRKTAGDTLTKHDAA